MNSPRLPDNGAGVEWRHWTTDDASALAAFMLRVHEAERLEHVPGPEFFGYLASQDGFDPATDGIIATDAEGNVRAEGGAWIHLTDLGSRVFIWADADPDHLDLRGQALAWAESRARQVLEAAPSDKDRIIRLAVEEHREHMRAAAEAAGFEASRSFAVMRRSLANLPDLPPLADGLTVEPWSEAIDPEIRDANNEAFADHWGSLPMTEEMWKGQYHGTDIFRPESSFAALDGSRVVSFVMVEFDPEDVATRGSVEHYIQRVGTRRSHRRMGVASHLLVRSLQASAAAGAETSALEVDESSHTNATVVYARLGFEIAQRSIHYVKKL